LQRSSAGLALGHKRQVQILNTIFRYLKKNLNKKGKVGKSREKTVRKRKKLKRKEGESKL
jgi:hypothetical protein